MKNILWLVAAVAATILLAMSCTPKRWIKEDPRTVTPVPTVTIEDSVSIDIGSNTVTAR